MRRLHLTKQHLGMFITLTITGVFIGLLHISGVGSVIVLPVVIMVSVFSLIGLLGKALDWWLRS